MSTQTIDILESIDQHIKIVKEELEKHPEGHPQHMYYKGLLEGLRRAWNIAYNLI